MMRKASMNPWTLAACIAILGATGCKSEKSAPAEATPSAAAEAADKPEARPDDRANARLEAARKRRAATEGKATVRPIPKVRTVEEHKEVTRQRITAENYKSALDRLERAVGNLERAQKRAPGANNDKSNNAPTR
jgi:hypothetical protein